MFFHASSQRIGKIVRRKQANSDATCLVWQNERMETLLGQLDISAVFDCVDHSMLLGRPRSVWFSPWLHGCGHFWPTERSRLPTVVNYLLYSRCCFGFRKDPYWARCRRTFSTQLSWPSLSLVMASTCTSTPMIRRSTSALRPATLRQPSHVSLRVSLTSRLGWRPADSGWTPPRFGLCGWVLPSSWPKSTS